MKPLHHREQGDGQTVILLHGFPMNRQVWDALAEKLSDFCHVVTPDLPGFGKSPAIGENFSLTDVARTIQEWIRHNGYPKPVIIGHSLGGYVALALAELDRDALSGLCLFHSTAFADSEERKQTRSKVLEFIDRQGVSAFTSNFIVQLYADPQHNSITTARNIAVQASKEAVVGYTRAMRDRPDRTEVLKTFPAPVLLLSGEKDGGIPADSITYQASLNPQAKAVILPDVAHMGMYEAPEQALKILEKFISRCGVTF